MSSKSPRNEKALLTKIQNIFASRFSSLKLMKDVTVGDLNADLYVQSPTGTTSVLQIKDWEPTTENQDRAKNLASIYKSLSNADNAYVVMPRLSMSDSDPEKGVIAPKDIGKLPEYLLAESEKGKAKAPRVQKAPTRIVFAAMPFAKNYDDTFEVGIQGACLELGYKAVRVDYERFSGDIVSEIKKLIRKSVAVVGDVSENRPNVMYEIGFAHASRKDVVQICSSAFKDNIPFDIRNNRTVMYDMGQTIKLKGKLIKELSAILSTTKS